MDGRWGGGGGKAENTKIRNKYELRLYALVQISDKRCAWLLRQSWARPGTNGAHGRRFFRAC